MPKVLITGGTGLIGTALTRALTAKGYSVIILTRKSIQSHKENISYAEWDVDKQTIDDTAIRKADYIVHLAGANLAEGRWTDKRKKEIRDSRVKSGELLSRSLKEIPNQVKAVISSSAIGYYGPDMETEKKVFIETDPPYHDFLSTVVQQWEGSISAVKESGKRLVIFRTGIVLSNEGGAFVEFKKPLRFRVAGILGNGKQVVSWIHIDDLVRLHIEAIENEKWNGIYNAVAPEPVSNSELIQTMGAEMGKKYICIHAPTFALKIILGEMSIEVLKSTTVSSEKVLQQGYQFLFPDVRSAVEDLLRSNTER